MKRYTKIWLVSFAVTVLVLSLAIIVFMTFMKDNYAVGTKTDPAPKTEVNIETDYVEPQDNVGAVSFTEDQMTELARNLFSLDGFLTDLSLELDDGKMTITARIKDKEKLIETYPELKKFNAVITSIENRKIIINGSIVNNDGRAAVKISDVSVGGMEINGDIIAPFIEADEFSSLFDVDFENIEISDGEVVFRNGVPDILRID